MRFPLRLQSELNFRAHSEDTREMQAWIRDMLAKNRIRAIPIGS